MSVDERTRHEMYSGLEEKLGTSVADALMAHLPLTGWADVARRDDVSALRAHIDAQGALLRRDLDAQGSLLRDLDAQGALLRAEMEAMEARLGARIHAESNRLLYFMVPSLLTTIGLSFAAATLR